jgi:hypothetical protein
MSNRSTELRPAWSVTDGNGDPVDSTGSEHGLELAVAQVGDHEHDPLDCASTNAADETLVVPGIHLLDVNVGAESGAKDDDVHGVSFGAMGGVGSARPSPRW